MTPTTRVNPGDLITAEFVNRLLDVLNDHQLRIAALESTGGGGDQVVITSFDPPTATVRVGQNLTIFGRNFGQSAGRLRVFIDGTSVDNFNRPGTNDTTIIITLPAELGNPPSTGRSALLTVSNSATSAQRSITVLPSADLIGNTPITQVRTDPQTPASNAPFTVFLRMDSQLSRNASVDLTATVVGLAVTGSQFVNASGAVISNTVPLDPGASFTFGVRIQIPTGSDSANFTVALVAVAEGANRFSGSLPFTVGTPAEQPDSNVSVSISPTANFNGAGGTFNGGVLSLRASAGALVTLPTLISKVGNYSSVAVQEAGATGWTTNFTENATFTVTDSDLANPKGQTLRNVRVSVLRGQGIVVPGRIRLRVRRDSPDPSNGSSDTVTLALLA